MNKTLQSLLLLTLVLVGATRGQAAGLQVDLSQQMLPEPLEPVGDCGVDDKKAAFLAVSTASRQDDVQAMQDFLKANPDSCFAPSMALEAGLLLKQRGYYNEALQVLQGGWEHSRS
ncbi:MAG TPA: hypothetical protein VNZ67_05145, partial [bacterium]|nr:hypothetical protein [bacterium]